mgnify:CR=1 FL=1
MRRETRLFCRGLSASFAAVCAAQDVPLAFMCTGGDSISPSMCSRVRRLLRKMASCSADMAVCSSAVGDSVREALAEGAGSGFAEENVVVGARMIRPAPRGEAPASGATAPSSCSAFMISSSWPSTSLVAASAIASSQWRRGAQHRGTLHLVSALEGEVKRNIFRSQTCDALCWDSRSRDDMRQNGSLSLGAVLGGAVAVAAAMYYYLHLRRVSAVVRRAAFDIGSGYTKMLVADVKDGAIVGRVVLETEVKLSYKVDAQQSPDGSLSEAIQAEGLACFRELTAKALTQTLTLTLTLTLT